MKHPEKFDICIDVSWNDDFDFTDPEHILSALNDDIEISMGAIDFTVNDDRAVTCEGTESFAGVERKRGNRWRAYWSFEWSVYSGCKDFCYGDEVEGSTEIIVSKDEGKIYLSEPEYPEQRTTYEEF